MKQNLSRWFERARTTFAAFTPGQKAVVLVGTAALLLAGFLVFRWAATPDYAPLYSNLAAEDASAVVDELNTEGVAYQLANGGSTVLVPREQVYDTRIALSGKGLPGTTDSGYSLLDGQDLSTSQFQEQTDFKRAMEGELSRTVEAIDGVQTAVVHLALPPAKVFADEQDPPTASVLLDTTPGTTLSAEQVQAVVHLVASSIDGLSPDKVTVADATGRVLSVSDGSGGLGVGARDQQVSDYEQHLHDQIQRTLDRVFGVGNSTVQVTADLDFDRATQDTTTYRTDPQAPPLSSSTSTEDYTGPGGATSGSTGVVGPDGQMGSTTTSTGGDSSYSKEQTTRDNAVDTVVEHRETAPGSVNSQHIGVVLDSTAAASADPNQVRSLISDAVGIDVKRGDTVNVSIMPFDRSADDAAAKELAAAAAAKKQARTVELLRDAGIALAVLAILLLAWIRGRRRRKAQAAATTYLAEQIRLDSAQRAVRPPLEETPALAALERSELTPAERTRDELSALVEKQPEHVAALLRGWLAERD